MKTAAAYIRVSTEDQIEFSPDSQIKAIQNYAEKNDLTVPEEFIFVDEGISGRTTKRPAFVKMISLAKIKPKPFDVILVWKFSRFARNREDSVVYKSMLRKQYNIDVISISENIGDDKMSGLIEAMIEAMDEYYSINLGEEVKRGMTEKAKRGGVLTNPPFGYYVENGQYIINYNEAFIIKKVFSDYLNGKGFLSIAKELNAMGIRTHKGNKIETRTIEYWLNNPMYIGKIRWNPVEKTKRNYQNENLIISDGSHKAIIDEDTWAKVQKKLFINKEYYRKNMILHDRTQVSHWLVGILRCGICGAVLVNCGGYFYCSKKNKGLCGGNGCVSLKVIEKIVIEELEKTLNYDVKDIVVSFLGKKPDNSEIMSIQVQIKRAQLKLNRIKEAYEDGIDSLAEYKTNKNRILSEIEQLNQRKSVIEDTEKNKSADKKIEVKKDINRLLEILKSSDVDNNLKNNVAKSIIKEIVKTGQDGKTFKIIFWNTIT